jgi:HK97 gp10 family phage protein
MDAVIDGLESLMRKLEAKQAQVKRATKRGVTKACLIVEAYAKENMTPESPSAPGEPPAVVLGTLKASITHRVEEEDMETAGYTGTSLEDYPKALEFGTSRMAARPFMFPALEKNRANIVNAIKDELEAAE